MILTIQTIRERLLASTMIGGVALMAAVAIPAVAIVAAPTSASAQDYTSGTLTGSVKDTAGVPVSGATVVVVSSAQGVSRTATTDASGNFRVALIPTGQYNVTVSGSSFPSISSDVRVNPGSESGFSFTVAAADGLSTVDDIVVTGVRAELDFAQTTKGVTIDVEDLLDQVPIARNITAVTLLAPTVVPGTGGFNGLPSIGGSTVAENAFYVNGLNITNFDTYVGSATVPFDFYKTVEVKTGGYPAEFGRAAGGVINAVTKSGTNDFMFAVHANWQPNSLRETPPDTNTSGGISYNTRQEVEQSDYTVEIGGPIIRDRLFAYGLYQWRDTQTKGAANATYTEQESDDPFWGVKLDGYITDEHRLEFTYFNTEGVQTNSPFAYNGATDTVGAASPQSFNDTGGESYIGKYTGTITNWLTLSAAYGVSETRASTRPEDTLSSRITESRFATVDAAGNPLPAASRRPAFISSTQKTAGSNIQSAEREFYRFDADLYFDFWGQHHVRAGYDNESNTLNHVSDLNGGRIYNLRRGTGLGVGYGVAAGQDFVQVQYQRLGGQDIDSENQSYYIQDAWDVTDDLSFQIGLRYDSFLVEGLSEEKSFDLKDNWGPRVGFTWDPVGQGVDKFYGSYGRYFIPPASNLAYRGADFGFSEFFLIAPGQAEGVVPVLGQQLSTTTVNPLFNPTRFVAQTSAAACPAGGFGAEGVIGCSVTLGRGIPERAFSKTSQQLEATNEDEFILGYTRRLDDLWTVGAAVTYRKLNKVSEDITLDGYVVQYCADNGFNVAACAARWDGSWQYVVINPGEDIDIYTRGALPGDANPTCFGAIPGTPALTNCGTLIHLTAEELGYPKPKREYLGLEMTFDRAFDGTWGLRGSYVLSKSTGNYEGTVLSDNGQTDAGSTILFDYPGLADYQDGPLPNHRLHQFKLYGNYQVFQNFSVGGNFSLVSPQKYGCLGIHPTDDSAASYGSSSRYCGGVPAYRGSRIESDWITRFDLSLRFTPTINFLPGNAVFRADIFNVFNIDGAQELDETYDDDGETMLPTYGSVVTYQAPRQIRFGLDWQF